MATRGSRPQPLLTYLNRYKYLYLMLIPCVTYFIIFRYVPMYGVLIAFKDFSFSKGILGSDWVGLENFRYMFGLSTFWRVFKNSLLISSLRILLVFPVPIILALMINEIMFRRYKRVLQTVLYLPHFISWVIIGGIIINFLSPVSGVVNLLIKAVGHDPIFFMGETRYFVPIVILSSVWKEAGWGTIIYLAAISAVDPTLYEAAIVDGANRWQRMLVITIPSILSTIVILTVLQLGSIMSVGFEQIFILQNPINLPVSEVFETYAYRQGIVAGRYSFATTVGLFTSVIALGFLIAANRAAKALNQEAIW
jgi:putative aldouronate transport system permease protein